MRNIRLQYEYLQRNWESRKDIVIKQWCKLKIESRAKLLKEAAPNLLDGPFRGPLCAVEIVGRLSDASLDSLRMGLLLDFLTVDCLKADPARLIGLLKNRVYYAPDQWAVYDNQRLEWAWWGGLFIVEYSPLCMKMAGSAFGTLVSWTNEAARNRDIIGFPRAKLVLESQDVLLQFLCKIVNLLAVNDKQLFAIGKFHEPCLSRTGDKAWSTYSTQPFSQSPLFDSNEILEKAQIQLNKAKNTSRCSKPKEHTCTK